MELLEEGKNGILWQDFVVLRSGDERRRQLGREAPYLLNFMDATAMMSVHWTLHSLTGRRGV